MPGTEFCGNPEQSVLFHFLKRYTVDVKPGYEMNFQTVPLAMPKDGLVVQIHRR